MKLLLEKKRNYHLVLVGDGAERASLIKYAEELDISAHIHFVGFQENVSDYLKTFDVFVLSSVDEGLPLAMLEAMLHGVPVICSRVGGIPEVIIDGYNGFLFPPGDEEELMDKIYLLLSSKEKQQLFVKTACQYC